MTNVELKMVFNPETDEVDVLVDGEVLLSSGVEEFKSWSEYYVDKHKPAVEEKVVDVTPLAEPVVPPAEPVPPVDNEPEV